LAGSRAGPDGIPHLAVLLIERLENALAAEVKSIQ